MPQYKYKCTECNHEFEELQSINDEPITICPKCNGKIGQWCWTGTLINHVIALEYILYPHNTTLHMP